MDWKEFKDKLGNIQAPDEFNGFSQKFLTAQNSIHLSIGKWNSENFKLILDTVSILEERGAKRCLDYIVTASWTSDISGVRLEQISIHTTDLYMSPEDFVDIEIG